LVSFLAPSPPNLFVIDEPFIANLLAPPPTAEAPTVRFPSNGFFYINGLLVVFDSSVFSSFISASSFSSSSSFDDF